jgi:hypothetical protein
MLLIDETVRAVLKNEKKEKGGTGLFFWIFFFAPVLFLIFYSDRIRSDRIIERALCSQDQLT